MATLTTIGKVTDPAKIVTDVSLLSALARQGVDRDYVEFVQDYATAIVDGVRVKGRSPYAKFYADRLSGKRFMVVSGLPMVDADGLKIVPRWAASKDAFESENNLFTANVALDGTTSIVVKNDQPDGTKAGATLAFRPQLFMGGIEQKCGKPSLLAVDPVNPNYLENTIEWDYGICQRRLRLVEGRLLGSWVFDKMPKDDITIRYNQAGDFRLRLVKQGQSEDEENILRSYFDRPELTWPVMVQDSLEFYPDANPETSTVDGIAGRSHVDDTWSNTHDLAGNESYPSLNTLLAAYIRSSSTTNKWISIYRSVILFDTSSLPDAASITDAILSIYGSTKSGGTSWGIKSAVCSSNPATNTDVVPADYGTFGTTEFSNQIAYADWNVTSPYWNDYTLNAAGKNAISKTGITKFGTREAVYDIPNSPPSWASNVTNYMYGYSAEQGEGYKPKLVVTYIASVQDTIQAIWNVCATLAGVSQQKWNVRHVLSDASQLVWHVNHGVGDAIQAVWNARHTIVDSVQVVWDVLHLVAQDVVELAWDVRHTVSDAVQHKWNVRHTLSDASRLVWNIGHGVSDSIQAVWHVRHTLADSVQAVWDVLHMVATGTASLVWNVRYALHDSSAIRWHVRHTASDASQYVWSVALIASATPAQLLWNVRGLAGQAASAVWSVRRAISDGIQALWDTLAQRLGVLQLIWKVRRPTILHVTVNVLTRGMDIMLPNRESSMSLRKRDADIKLFGRETTASLTERNIILKVRDKA